MEDLLPGTILYTDDIDLNDKNGVIPTIKKVTTDFENETVMDTVIDGKAVTRSIPERIVFWLSSVDTITDVQLGTRFNYSATQSGEGHDHEVNHKQKGRCLGAAPDESNEKILICRCMLEYICDNLYNVFSAYGFVSKWSEESRKRNQEKFLDVLLSVTVFKYRQRETIRGDLIGTLEDWKRAVSIYAPVAKNNSSLLTDEEYGIIYEIYKMGIGKDEGAIHKELYKHLKETKKFNKSESTLKRMLIGDKTGKKGFLEKVPGFSFRRIVKPVFARDDDAEHLIGVAHPISYFYDGDLFDDLPVGEDGVIAALKNRTFVSCDYNIAETLEQAFRDDPTQIYRLKNNSGELENWRQKSFLEGQKSAEISRNQMV